MKLWSATLLWLVLVLLLIANSADFFFHRPFYEWWDSAANAFSIERAKHFKQLYGAYSRWGFCHPGPVLFYVQAFGEWLFYDRLHLTPAPFNAQTLLHLGVMTGCFVASLRVFSHWLPRRAWQLFLPLAIALAALHYAAMTRMPSYDVLRAPTAFAGIWPVHAIVLPFACLLIAGASVAAGRARDLPLLFLCAGVLLQLHVAQPLFVFPVVLLSWLGLLLVSAASAGRENAAATWTWKLGAAWRDHRPAHLLALLIVVFTALPVLIDATWGATSNLAAIVDHLRTHRGEHKSWGRSVVYFLEFGAYSPYRAGDREFGPFNHAGAMAFLRAHAWIYALWIAGIVVGLTAAIRRPVAVVVGDAATPEEAQPPSRRFLACFTGLLVLVIGLTLYWGTIQDGSMYYYNAWFNFGIYGAGVLVIAAAVALLAARFEPGPGSSRWPRVAAWAVAILVCAALARPFRISDPAPEVNAAMHDGIGRAIAALTPPGEPPTVRVLECPDPLWDGVNAVALQLARDGQRFVVPDRWGIAFAENDTWSAYVRRQPRPKIQAWVVEPSEATGPGVLPFTFLHDQVPVRMTVGLQFPPLDPAGPPEASTITFQLGGNADRFIVGGWGQPEPQTRWTDSTYCVLSFRPMPCGEDGVQMTLDAVPLIAPQAGITRQRLRLSLNGQPVGEEKSLTGAPGPATWHIPATLWNAAAGTGRSATLEMELPDATSPHKIDPKTRDLRVLGLAAAALHVAPWKP